MPMVIARHKVQDYGKWRTAFDLDVEAQKAAGLTNPRVLRSVDDKNEVVILFDIKDLKKLRNLLRLLVSKKL